MKPQFHSLLQNRKKFRNPPRKPLTHMLRQPSYFFVAERDEYPKILVAAYKHVTGWSSSFQHNSTLHDSVYFHMVGKDDKSVEEEVHDIPSFKGKLLNKDRTTVVCFECGGNHYHNDCKIYKEKQVKKHIKEEKVEGENHITILEMTTGEKM